MKNIKQIITLLALVALVSACKKYDYQYTYEGENLIQLIDESGTYYVLEGDTISYDVNFQLVGSPASSNVSVSASFLDSAEINGTMVYATIKPGVKGFSASANEVVIPAGEFNGILTVQGTYNELAFGEIEVALLQITDGTVKADSYKDVFVMQVQKYYPYDQAEYPGYYPGTYEGAILGAVVPASPGLTIEAGNDFYELVITSGFYQEQIDDWGETWTDGPYPITIVMNDADPTNFLIELPGPQYIGTTNDTWDYWAQPVPQPGSFNAASKQLEIVFYVAVYGGDQPPQDLGVYNVTLDDAAAKMITDRTSRTRANFVQK